MSSKNTYESYKAVANAEAARTLAATESPFTIEVRFLGGLTEAEKDAFKAAADRWAKAIVGDLPSVVVDGEVVDDVLILAQGTPIDGAGASWARQARPICGPRPALRLICLPRASCPSTRLT